MSSILEFRKRSLKLRSRLKKNLQKNTTNKYVNKLECNKIELPFGPDLQFAPHIIPSFLTEKECTSFINFLHKNRAKPEQERKAIKKKSVVNYNNNMRPRGLTWTLNKSQEISGLIYERFFNFLPKVYIDKNKSNDTVTIWEISGINDDIKSLKYGAGDVLCPHYDTPYIKSKNEKSFITTVLYLNDDFVGGSFEFLNPNNQNVIYPINIKSGTCLLFQHNTFHKGSEIQKGTKYIIRFDILYRKTIEIKSTINQKDFTQAKKKSCVWL